MLKINLKVFKIFVLLYLTLFGVSRSYANNDIFLEFEKYDEDFKVSFDKKEEEIFKNIRKNLNRKKFSEAYVKTLDVKDRINKDVLQTFVLAEGFKQIKFLNYKNFLNLIKFNTENYFLSTFDNFHAKIEYYYVQNSIIKFLDIKDYFEKFEPKNILTIDKFLIQREKYIYDTFISEDLIREKNKLDKQVLKIWLDYNFTQKDLVFFYKKYKRFISEENLIKKMDLLVMQNKGKEMAVLIPFLPDIKYQFMFKGILEIQKNPKYINHILRSIPKNFLRHESLEFVKMKYYRKNDKDKNALKIITSLENRSKYPKYWWLYRHIYTRDLIKEKEYKKAYNLVIKNGLTGKGELVDAEWLAGWLSLRYLKNPEQAIKHFNVILEKSVYPISLSRAYYWLGRSYQELKNKKQAIYWYKKGADLPLTFYGQLSISTLMDLVDNEEVKLILPTTPVVTKEDIKSIENDRIIRFAYFYYKYLNERTKSLEIFKHIINISDSKGKISGIIKLTEKFKNKNFTMSLAKTASYKQVFFINYLYLVLKDIKLNDEYATFVHSIIKQESAFNITATSPVGASGLMQIMPATAQVLCKDLKIKYDKHLLKTNVSYNVRLGTFYIRKLMKQFDGSKILSIASYNAGPKATKRWIKSFGDPRVMTDVKKVLDWLESITYGETRNYVQRVLENMVVYDALFEKLK